MEYAITLENVTKRYGKHMAADQVSLHIKKGEIYGFIGRNGAGKTTCMKMICGLATPTSGEISLLGHSGDEKKDYYARIGSLMEAPGIYPNMTAMQNLIIKSKALGMNKKDYLVEILDLVGLSGVGRKKVKQFSLGMKQRLGIGLALVGEPDILVLDEPINGLDPQGIAEVRQVILDLNQKKEMTIMVSSHILEELSKIADHYGIIDNGRMIEELTKDELLEKCSTNIQVVTSDTKKAVVILDSMDIHNYKVIDNTTIRIFEHLDEAAQINRNLVMGDCEVSSIQMLSDELEKYFIDLTGGGR